jgi:hypothetical protein
MRNDRSINRFPFPLVGPFCILNPHNDIGELCSTLQKNSDFEIGLYLNKERTVEYEFGGDRRHVSGCVYDIPLPITPYFSMMFNFFARFWLLPHHSST